MKKIDEEDIINQVYNFIVNPNITREERNVFINFKNKLDKKIDFENELMNLSDELREIAIKNISKKEHMTPEVREFYKDIISYGQLKLNWARGLSSYDFLF